ncbi:hypothetical protein GALMADRAFT_208447 [Galerina marginata CBS 339.88]|uniref:AB hydrolase-1 domain-containing protein n=1 Tax=Galerina marginata (strain CBS 339.88) TaxID=685588 RepID=A0A067TAT4_GALM3|nr:hypothetical protein GALMADRAFT_208447 [Galerina marginata CBS 339.88]
MGVESTGKVDFKVGLETYQTWYKVYGDLKNSGHRPVVALHGGPGMSHHYMLPHKTIFEKAGIPVLFYDQIGNGASSHCPGVPKEFWTPELFMDELDNILQALGIYDDFDLLGQSWGGMLAAQYAASRTPKGLKRLVIASSPASLPLMITGIEALLDKFPPGFAETIRKHEAEGTFEAKEYQEATQTFYKKHVCTVDPRWGPSEFSIVGSLKDWSIVDILHKIPYPTLLISGSEDEVQEISCIPFVLNIPKIKWVEIQNSTHLPEFEEPERYFQVILNFLNDTNLMWEI